MAIESIKFNKKLKNIQWPGCVMQRNKDVTIRGVIRLD